MLVDKQPYNTAHLAAIRRLFPEARVVVALRDPRDACLSLFMQDIRPNQDNLHLPTLADAADLYVAMMTGYVRNRGSLGLAMLEYRYEAIVENLESEARRIVEFLGVPWDPQVLTYYEQARRARRSSINIHAVTKPIYSRAVARWTQYADRFAPLESKLGPFVEAFGYGGGS